MGTPRALKAGQRFQGGIHICHITCNVGYMKCGLCEKPTVARGWCRLHYERWKRQGDPLKTVRTPNHDAKGRKQCRVGGCPQHSRSRGLCRLHYEREIRTGTTGLRPEVNHGASKHPLNSIYKTVRRSGLVDRWLIFSLFVEDVGERPHPNAKLLRQRHDEPFGPNNFKWSSPRKAREQGQWARPANKAWHERNNRKVRESMLRFRFGIGMDEYEAMESAQGGVCSICRKRPTGRRLVVDHCHATGVIRGLLCTPCNTGLGNFKDDGALLGAAIAYLGKEHTPWTVKAPDMLQGIRMASAGGVDSLGD